LTTTGKYESEFSIVFSHFGVTKSVKYGTFQDLSRKLIDERGNVRDLTKALCEGTLKKQAVPSRSGKKRVLLVDEVEAFFSKYFLVTPTTLL
jgi:hypothetical protein